MGKQMRKKVTTPRVKAVIGTQALSTAINYEFALTDEEILKYKEFLERHKSCDPEKRDALIEETVSPIMSIITLNMTSIGMCPFVKCLVCNQHDSIACDERLDSF